MKVAGVILAGGQATRMGGGDKCLRPLGGQPILQIVVGLTVIGRLRGSGRGAGHGR